MYQSLSSVCATRISLDLMIDAGVLFSSCRRLIFGGLVIALGLTGKSLFAANKTYSEAKRQFSDRKRDVFMNDQSPHKWWSTLKSALFGSSSSLPLVIGGGGLVYESVGKVDLLSDHFDSKMFSEAVDLPLACNTSSSLPLLPSGRVRSGISCWTWTLMVALTH